MSKKRKTIMKDNKWDPVFTSVITDVIAKIYPDLESFYDDDDTKKISDHERIRRSKETLAHKRAVKRSKVLLTIACTERDKVSDMLKETGDIIISHNIAKDSANSIIKPIYAYITLNILKPDMEESEKISIIKDIYNK